MVGCLSHLLFVVSNIHAVSSDIYDVTPSHAVTPELATTSIRIPKRRSSYEHNLSPSNAFIAHRAQRPSPADVGVDQIRTKKLQNHACAHKRVSVFHLFQ